MYHYSVFGGHLQSELALPDLPAATCRTADWSLVVCHEAPPLPALTPLGEHTVEGAVYRLFRFQGGWRLVFADHYVFDIVGQGARIVWYATADVAEENVRALLLGPVLALALQQAGALCLHGSAVAIRHQGVAFLASKYHGKSTLGLALALAGAKHLSDDVVVVEPEKPVRVLPGVHSVRLWNDSAARLGTDTLDCVRVNGMKNTLTELPERLLQRSPAPLAAVCLLRSVGPGEAAAVVERRPLSLTAAALALIQHTKIPQTLVGAEASGAQFLRAAAIAGSVPVFELRVVRDFDRLPEVVDHILAWYGASRSQPHPASAAV